MNPTKNKIVKSYTKSAITLSTHTSNIAKKFCELEGLPCDIFPLDVVEKLNTTETNTVMFLHNKYKGLKRNGYVISNFTMIEPSSISRFETLHPKGCVVVLPESEPMAA